MVRKGRVDAALIRISCFRQLFPRTRSSHAQNAQRQLLRTSLYSHSSKAFCTNDFGILLLPRASFTTKGSPLVLARDANNGSGFISGIDCERGTNRPRGICGKGLVQEHRSTYTEQCAIRSIAYAEPFRKELSLDRGLGLLGEFDGLRTRGCFSTGYCKRFGHPDLSSCC